jgi:outer membrane murein-binding lipoprotein Lpp
MKKTVSLLTLMVLGLSLSLSACSSNPKDAPGATPEEIAAAEAEVKAAEEQLAVAENEAREAMEAAREDQSPENIAVFMEKRDAYLTAQSNLDKANANLRKLRR